MTAAEIVTALGGRGDYALCPTHKEKTPSLHVTDGPEGKTLVHCFGGCSQDIVWAALQRRGLVKKRAGRATLSSRADGRADALAFWEASRPALHTPAEEYLRCRGIIIEPPACIRYHEGKHCLVALVQSKDGSFSGIQRIYLKTDSHGTWATGKFSLGAIKGGAVRLTPPAETLQLTESVEDGLALLQMTGKPTWAVPGATFFEGFEPPEECRKTVLAPDNDPAGLANIKKAAPRLQGLGLQVRTMIPPGDGRDWCDILEAWDERAGIIAEGCDIEQTDAGRLAWEALI
jgi:DNA primase